VLGLSADDVIGKRLWECPCWHPRLEVAACLREASERAAEGRLEHLDVPAQVADRVRWLELTLAPVRGETGRAEYLTVFASDITERNRADAAILAAEEQARQRLAELEDLYHNAPVGLCVLDRDLRFVRINERLAEINGIPAAEHVGKTVRELLPRLADAVEPGLRQVLVTGQPRLDIEIVGETPAQPGIKRSWTEQWLPITDANGRATGLSVVVEETTERKKAQALVQHLAQQRQLALDAAKLGWWEYNPVTRMAAWDDGYKGIFGVTGYTRPNDEILRQIIHAEDLPGLWAKVEAALNPADPQPFAAEYRINRPDGQLRWIEAHGVAAFHGEGAARRAINFVGTVQDITERKLGEEELARARRLAEQRAADLEAVLHAVPAAVWIAHDPDCRHVSGNRTANEWLRLPEGAEASLTAAAGDRPTHFRVRHEGRELVGSELPVQRAATGVEVRDFEEEIVFADGSPRHALGNATPLWDEHGKPRGSVAAFVDITARKRAEDELREADQRKDEFLAMLAHELRNPLTPIRNAVHIMGRIELANPRLSWARETIEHQVIHLSRLVDDLLDISRIVGGKITLRKETTDLATVVRQAVMAVQPTLDQKGHALAVQLPTPPVTLDADPVRLAQILVNLLDNAAKYTPDGGHIGLTAQLAGQEVEIRIQDDGCGIAPTLLPHVFDLFEQGEAGLDRAAGGLGIGLALVERLTALHGGRVEAASAGAGRGATFTVWLPATRQAIVSSSARDAGPSGDATRQRILVVDDDKAVRTSTAMWLEMEGHEIRVAASGPEAIEAAVAFHPDVVLLDVGLPGMDGYDVARQLRALPGGDAMLLVAVTGYGNAEAVVRSRAVGFDHHVVKPFDPQSLLDLLVVRPRR
jgi:PAS domain S-box-containing protein